MSYLQQMTFRLLISFFFIEIMLVLVCLPSHNSPVYFMKYLVMLIFLWDFFTVLFVIFSLGKSGIASFSLYGHILIAILILKNKQFICPRNNYWHFNNFKININCVIFWFDNILILVISKVEYTLLRLIQDFKLFYHLLFFWDRF